MLLVSATNWTDSQHTSLLRYTYIHTHTHLHVHEVIIMLEGVVFFLRCVRDHLDVPCLLLAVDELSLPELAPAIGRLALLSLS